MTDMPIGAQAPSLPQHRALGVLAARLIGLQKLFLRTEVTGLDEIHDAPQIEQAVF